MAEQIAGEIISITTCVSCDQIVGAAGPSGGHDTVRRGSLAIHGRLCDAPTDIHQPHGTVATGERLHAAGVAVDTDSAATIEPSFPRPKFSAVQVFRATSIPSDCSLSYGLSQGIFLYRPPDPKNAMLVTQENKWWLAVGLIIAQPLSAPGQDTPGKDSGRSFKDLAYNDKHESQKLDVYLATSDKPVPAMVFIHGGGWRAGSKKNVPQWLQKAVSNGWLSVVSVEYRFTNVAPHPAQTNDCLRAIQFIRHHAAKWNIDPKRIGVTGGSAGGHLSLWVALHDDVADSDSKDAIERESSRVACAVSFAGPTDWRLLGEIEHQHPAYRQVLGFEPGTPVAEMNAEGIQDVSPISFVSKDDPAIMQVHGDADVIVPIEHARRLDMRLQNAGVSSELVVIRGANHSVASAGPRVSSRPQAFVRELLTQP